MIRNRGSVDDLTRTKGSDEEFSEGAITRATYESGHWSISYDEDPDPRYGDHASHMGIGWDEADADLGSPTPKVGDRIRVYGSLGYPFWGIDVAGRQVFYHTGADMRARWEADRAKYAQEKIDRFEAEKVELDQQYDALPPIFQRRIDRFRQTFPEWRIEYEGYEMFVCTSAVALARWVNEQRDRQTEPKPGIRDLLTEYYENAIKAEWREAHPMAPYDEGHSGNSFGKSVLFAQIYLEDERWVPFIHGAMTGLVGCEEFGCHGSKAIWMDELEALSAEKEAVEA